MGLCVLARETSERLKMLHAQGKLSSVSEQIIPGEKQMLMQWNSKGRIHTMQVGYVTIVGNKASRSLRCSSIVTFAAWTFAEHALVVAVKMPDACVCWVC